MKLLDTLKQKAREMKRELYVVYLCMKHPRTPWYTKALIGIVLAYALSPIDLIPDFIPVLGLLDDLLLVPLGIALALKSIPEDVRDAMHAQAESELDEKKNLKSNWIAAAIIVLIWLLAAFLILKSCVFK